MIDFILYSTFISLKTRASQLLFLFLFLFLPATLFSQSCGSNGVISEYLPNKVSGSVNFTVIGNTQNPFENNSIGVDGTCESFNPILTTQSELVIPSGDNIIGAYLYWSGTGSVDASVELNGQTITAQRCWTQQREALDYFAAYADVTTQVQTTGEGIYEFTGLNNSGLYSSFQCAGGAGPSTLYGGWSLIVILENDATYEDFTIFYYDGFRLFRQESFSVNIQSNVYDEFENSKVGVIAWEGDQDPNISGDDIRLNGVLLPSPNGGYSSPDNIFNGTNSFVTPSNQQLFNADFDSFDASSVVEDQMNTEAANFDFELTSLNDLILLNAVLLKIPNQAPDAVIETETNLNLACVDDRSFPIEFTYSNLANASRNLPQDTPINFYLNSLQGEIIGTAVTDTEVGPGESATGSTTLTLPGDYLGTFEIIAYIDDPNGQSDDYGLVLELLEENNTFTAEGFFDQDYYDLELQRSICEGESILINGNLETEPGFYPFNEQTVLGGCDSIGVVELFVFPTFEDPPVEVDICEEDLYTLPGGTTVSPPPSPDRYTYVDTLSTINNCDSIVTTELLVKPIERREQRPEICVGQEFELPGGTLVSETGTYVDTLIGAAANGCNIITTTELKVLNIFYPNAFAPNGNGKNEGFKAVQPEVCPVAVTNYNLRIYNKWGEKVFESTDINEAWDGRFKENRPDLGFYIWHATYDTPSQSGIERTGGVTLIQ